MWSQSHHHLLAVFHCCAPFIGYQSNIESISRSACWPTTLLKRHHLFTFAPCLLLLFHHAHWDQTEGITLSVPRIRTNTSARAFSSCTPSLWNKPSTICPFSHLGCHLQKTSQNIPFRLGLPPVDTSVPNGLLMLRNSLNDFVFEHRSGCCATEPGYAGDIGAIEIWLIDWLIRIPLNLLQHFIISSPYAITHLGLSTFQIATVYVYSIRFPSCCK